MTTENEYKILVGGYYGIREMDNYKLKEYILKDIEEYIKNFVALHKDLNYDYSGIAEKIEDTVSLKEKLQDSLLILRKINGPLELILMVKERISELK